MADTENNQSKMFQKYPTSIYCFSSSFFVLTLLIMAVKLPDGDSLFQILKENKLLLSTVKPVYKGHSREPENAPFMSSVPLYAG